MCAINNNSTHENCNVSLIVYKYNRDQLIAINKQTHHVHNSTLSTVSCDKVCHRKKRKRGRCGGVRKRREINAVNNVFSSETMSSVNDMYTGSQKCINQENLINISTETFVQDTSSQLKVLSLNARSSRNKAIEINDIILESNADLVFITESWLKEKGDEPIIKKIVPNGFKPLSFPRTTRTGGGILVVYRQSLCISTSSSST